MFAGHVKATEQLLDELEANHEQVDVIVWPENAAEFAITDQPLRGRAVALISQRAGAPIVMGTVLANDDGTYSNSSVVWGPRGQQQPETTSRYDKRFPVPFAEYMPNRNFSMLSFPTLSTLFSWNTRRVPAPRSWSYRPRILQCMPVQRFVSISRSIIRRYRWLVKVRN